MKNESVKKSLEKSKNVLEEKRKMVKRKICIKKTNTFRIIAMNFVQEQLKTAQPLNALPSFACLCSFLDAHCSYYKLTFLKVEFLSNLLRNFKNHLINAPTPNQLLIEGTYAPFDKLEII